MVNNKIGTSDIWYFLIAFCLLFACQFLVLFVPFRWYIALFITQKSESGKKSTRDNTLIVQKALRRGLHYIPWKSKCLVQALAGKALLNMLHSEGTIYLGVTRDNRSLTAHAWLKSSDKFICGQKGYKKFTIVREIS
jgi:hypothetical protein